MRQVRAGLGRKGFALPTVLIASIVLLTVLAVAVSATTAVRTTLVNQYYAQLAQVAGEAGTAYAKSCLAANGNVPQWTDAKPLTPATDCSGNVQLSASVKALVVAGGGSGGGSTGGGGGAGGVLANDSVPITATTYPITVGAGGAVPGNQATGRSGTNSVFSTLTAIGGGGGGYSNNGTSGGGGLSGGSGGGGENYWSSLASGSGTVGQGFAGGPLGTAAGSGGGGAGGAGFAGVGTNIGGNGGPGIISNITGGNVYYASGGGGGNGGLASNGGGSNGALNAATNATPNTGGGGGGGFNYAGGNGGAGGSGIVIIAYPNNGNITATGGTITTSGLYKIHTFTSSGSFVVTNASASSCPSDPRCSVTVNGDVRSSFRVGLPTLDADGKAVSIPNTGYVEVTRTSNGSIWRTITQPTVQAAVVPDLCSGAASSGLGWNNAVRAATQDNFGPTSAAQTITLSNSALNAGYIFFRKDFAVTDPGSYNVNALTPSGSQAVDMFVDGSLVTTSTGSLSSGTITLAAGCHTVTGRFTNKTVAQQLIRFTASVQKVGKTVAAVSTDSSWRTAAGDTEHYTQPLYYADPSVWGAVRIYSDPGWPNDRSARNISTAHSYDGSNNYPTTSYAFFRDNRTITVGTPTQVSVNVACDDACVVYLDGEQVILTGNGSNWSTVNVTLQPGSHKFGVRLYNNTGPSNFDFGVFRSSDNAVLSQSDSNWQAANFWTATANQEFYSYDSTFIPSPSTIPTNNVQLLVVGGGGGGADNHSGGGGGGGVVYQTGVALSPRTYTVTVGAGGIGGVIQSGPTYGQQGGIGGASSFDTLFYALGGGGAGGRIAVTSVSPSLVGGSGGGGAGTVDAATGVAAAGAWGTLNQGNKGGNGSSDATAGQGGGGGGAGGVGGNASGANLTGVSGAGGAGASYSITGSSVCYAGGGSGGRWGSVVNGVGAPGCGGGAGGNGGGPNAGAAGTANTGGGGGGGSDGGGAGGNGGSGVVIIAFPTGSMTVSATGSPTVTTSGGNTIYTFTSSGTFTVVSIP